MKRDRAVELISIVLTGSQVSLKPVALLPQSAYASAKSALRLAARDMAEAVIFFSSDRARMITGQRLLVNAGEFYDI